MHDQLIIFHVSMEPKSTGFRIKRMTENNTFSWCWIEIVVDVQISNGIVIIASVQIIVLEWGRRSRRGPPGGGCGSPSGTLRRSARRSKWNGGCCRLSRRHADRCGRWRSSRCHGSGCCCRRRRRRSFGRGRVQSKVWRRYSKIDRRKVLGGRGRCFWGVGRWHGLVLLDDLSWNGGFQSDRLRGLRRLDVDRDLSNGGESGLLGRRGGQKRLNGRGRFLRRSFVVWKNLEIILIIILLT